jgi:hypothetical protein
MATGHKNIIFPQLIDLTLNEEEARTLLVIANTTAGDSVNSPRKHLTAIGNAIGNAGVSYSLLSPERHLLNMYAKFDSYPPKEVLVSGRAYQDKNGTVFIRNTANTGWIDRNGANRGDSAAYRPVKELAAA